MTDTATEHPPGATLHLGGDAWAHPSLTDRLVPIDTVTPYPGNPRRGDQDAITASIRDHGLYAGVVTQQTTGHILVGNHRRHALVDLGATMIPRDLVDVDDTRAAAIVARDNLTSDRGGYDTQAQYELLMALKAADALPLSGYDDGPTMALLRAQVEAEALMTMDPADVTDEFLGITGQAGDAVVERAFQTIRLRIRDEPAAKDLCERLGIDYDPQRKEIWWPEFFRRNTLDTFDE